MQKLALENNLSETAFIVKEKSGYHLRWFTPAAEIELCGHATLASTFIILTFYKKNCDEVRFNTLSGELTVKKVGQRYEMNFPTYKLQEIPVTDEMEKAFGARLLKAKCNCFFNFSPPAIVGLYTFLANDMPELK